jgi:predicted transcriptional regulator
MSKKHGFDTLENDQDSVEDKVDDKALIREFLPNSKKAIAKLKEMEVNNKAIIELKKKQVQEVRGEREKQNSEELSEKVRQNQSDQKFIKEVLDEMRQQVRDAKNDEGFKDEPE